MDAVGLLRWMDLAEVVVWSSVLILDPVFCLISIQRSPFDTKREGFDPVAVLVACVSYFKCRGVLEV